jgi:hypothetical protein
LSAGKYYFEVACVVQTSSFDGVGLGTAGATLGITATACAVERGTVWVNGASVGPTFGTYANGDVVRTAVDLDARLIWFLVPRLSGLWNVSGAANPATGVGGISISALSGALYPWATMGASTDSWTANFGATAFTGAVPVGFNSGWGWRLAAIMISTYSFPTLAEVEPGKWRVARKPAPDKRSALPMPHIISDAMDDKEQIKLE